MRARMECRILSSKNSAKLKQYCYFHAEFLEIRYTSTSAVWNIMHECSNHMYVVTHECIIPYSTCRVVCISTGHCCNTYKCVIWVWPMGQVPVVVRCNTGKRSTRTLWIMEHIPHCVQWSTHQLLNFMKVMTLINAICSNSPWYLVLLI